MPPKSTVAPLDALYFQHHRDYSVKYPDHQVAILLLVGKFYEMYDSIRDGKETTNVQAAAAACGCSVEPKPTDDPERQRVLWGFPEVALAKYERMLVHNGYTVVVFDQVKDGSGAVKSRPLRRISSPGTYFDEEEEERGRCGEERILLGVCIEPYTDTSKGQRHWYGAASAFIVSTGVLRSLEFDLLLLDGKPILDSLRSFLAMFPPTEVVVSWMSEKTRDCPSVALCKELFGGAHGLVIPVPKEDGTVAADRARLAFLRSIFRPRTALSLEHFLDIERYPFVRKSLAYLLSFIKDHNASFLTALPEHAMWSADTACLLGNAALHQLALLPRETEQESLLHWLLKGVSTVMGRRALRERCMKPTADVDVLEDRQARCEALRTEGRREALVSQLKGICDLSRLVRRFQLGTAGTAELVQLLRSYERIRALLVLQSGPPTLLAHVEALLSRWNVERIQASEAVVSDKIAIGTTHPWRTGIHDDLDACEDRWVVLYKEMMTVKQSWAEVLGDTEAVQWSLKDEVPFTFTTTARRGTLLSAKTPGLTREAKGASSTVVLSTDAVRAANAAAVAVRAEWRERAAEHWREDWTLWCHTSTTDGTFAELVDFVGDLDADCGLAIAADLYGYTRPTYVASEESGVDVVEMRHPIVERVHTSTPYISHSLSFGCFHDDKAAAAANVASTPCGILLYGVNAAGKSSLGKALGLTVLMAQIGMPVPATSMRLVPYTGIFTRILGNDDLWAGMSSFVVEMTELRSILRYADKRSLVIGDELCAGTETESAVALVAAGVHVLAERGVHFFFATHLHELAKEREEDDVGKQRVRSYHLTVKAVGSSLQYDRLLKEGSGSEMYGLEVCRGLDMDPEFLALAFSIRKRRSGETVGKLSRYNAAVAVSSCSLCGGTEGLETHHIVPQAAAVKGRIAAGVSKNVVSNLAVICEACHLKHNKGRLDIEGWKDTTEGRQLV